MKKFLGTLLVLLFGFIPVITNAKDATEININDYETLGLKETLAEEDFTEEFKNYSESENQINIYLFRGNGCTYCRSFLTFLNSITEEYGKYFKLVSFETWYNSDNSELLDTISEFVDSPAQGVPYIIIGENVFPGYASDYDDSIKEAITTLYNSDSRYDVFEAYNASLKEAKKAESSAMNKVIIWNFIFTTISTIIIIIVIRKTLNNNNIKTMKNEVSNIVEAQKEEQKPIEKKKPNKKNTKK